MADLIDRPRDVRPGEELDAAKLGAWLAARLGVSAEIEVRQFPSGWSNLTYLLHCSDGRELVLRRPPVGSKVKTAHDMGREHRILSRLHDVFPHAPRALASCDDPSVIGAPFYVMERIVGLVLRAKLPRGLTLAASQKRALDEAFVDELAALHKVDFAAAGLADLGHPEGYVRRQVEGWTKRWIASRTDEVADVERAARWLSDNLPGESGAALIHNDFKFDNLVVDADDPTKIIGVLDWEMSTIGDPLMDLGTALGYWVEPGDPPGLRALAFGPTMQDGSMTRRELAARYAEKTGRDTSGLLFHTAFALFKSCVVVQQIYKRWREGLTKDERFATLDEAVRVLAAEAVASIARGRF